MTILASGYTLFISRVLNENPLRLEHVGSVNPNSPNLFHCLQRLEQWSPLADVRPERDHEGHTYFRITEPGTDKVFFAVLASVTGTSVTPPCDHNFRRYIVGGAQGRTRCAKCKAILEKGD